MRAILYLVGLVGRQEGLGQVDHHTVVAGEDGHFIHLRAWFAQVDRAHEHPVRAFAVAAPLPVLTQVQEQAFFVLATVVVDPHLCTHRVRLQLDVGADDTDSDALGRRQGKHEAQGVGGHHLHPGFGFNRVVVTARAELVCYHGELLIVDQQLAGRLFIG